MHVIGNYRDAFRSFLQELGILDEEVDMWCLVFSEALGNAIFHGCENDASKKVRLEWRKESNSIQLTVQDPGEGPPREFWKHPKLPDDVLSIGGRGLYIIHEFCPDWEHWTGPDGYRMVLRKSYPHLNDPVPDNQELTQVLDELSACYEGLSAFYRLGSSLVTAENLGAFIEQSLETLREAHSLDYSIVSTGDSLQLSTRIELDGFENIRSMEKSPGLCHQVYGEGGEIIWESPDEVEQYEDLRGLGCGFCVPIQAAGKRLGTLTVGRVDNHPFLNAADLNNLRTFSDLFGIAFANRDLQFVRIREQQALHELEIAADIHQKLLLLETPPSSPHWEVVLKHRSAREVAGDFVEACYDDGGNLLMAIIDVMGKGVSAALLATIFRTALHLNLDPSMPLSELAQTLNRTLCKELGEMVMFVTCSLARVNKDMEYLETVNAGHCPTVVFRDGKSVHEVTPSGPPLGLFKDVDYQTERVELVGGESMMMVTDGLYEWVSGDDIFGWENLVRLSELHINHDPDSFWNILENMIAHSSDSEELSDDRTLLYWRKI